MYKAILIVALVATAALAAKVDYTGHMVIQVVPETKAQLEFLVTLQSEGHDFWDGPNHIGHASDIRVSPATYYSVAHRLGELGLSHKIKITDVGKLIENEEKEIVLRHAIHSGRAFDFEIYHSLPEIETFLTELDASSNRVSLESIGKTQEGHNIWMATVSSGTGSSNKPVMYFDCAMHSREWVTTASCLWIINELATKYGTDPSITAVLDYADWLITPVSNPDGYNYTWNGDRMWRKNRQPNNGSPCLGTDPNRNFDAEWGTAGASPLPCSDTYHGPSAFSAQEAAAMRDVILRFRSRIVAALSIHSYSQYWMSPYGYQLARPADYAEMLRVMEAGVNALEATYGTQFTYGTIYSVIYEASGSTVDWAYDTAGIKYAYALELRDTGRYGFILPADQILPTATELFNGLKAMTEAIRRGAMLRKY